MTDATADRLARLMHETWRSRYRSRQRLAVLPDRSVDFDRLDAETRDDLRAAARAVAAAAGTPRRKAARRA